MLKQRIITALILLAVLLAVLFYPLPWLFGAFMTLFMGAASWEWARLSGYDAPATWGWAVVAMLGCIAMLALGWPVAQGGWPMLLMACCTLAWLLCAFVLLQQGVGVWQRMARPVRMAGGLLALWAAWLAAVQLHGQFGVWYLLSVLSLVWVADIGAYFFGRALGKKKLAPTISPGKSWAGVWGGVGSVVVFAVLAVVFFPAVRHFYADLAQQGGWLVLTAVVVGMAALSVVGDLIESLMKRSMGMKDSSRLLPGHGGVLDRIDSILPILPLAVLAAQWLRA